VILEVAAEYGNQFGREYSLFEKYKLDDAEVAVVCLGSTAGTAKVVVDGLREKGVKAGLLKLRVFRPFPFAEIAAELSKLKAIAVLDRSDSYSTFAGPVHTEVTAALYAAGCHIPVADYIYGLGGRDVTIEHIESIYGDLSRIAAKGKIENLLTYVGVRE
jgi:pyruvate ferredoxin oxidoreductase alpha subunit